MKKVSIKDVAKAANVSVATISLVLSGKTQNGRVSAKTIQRVTEIAKQMDYRPNRLATSLKNGRTQTIGLLVADIANPFFGSLAYFIQDEMEKAGYAVIIMNTDEKCAQMEKMTTMLQSRQVDGFIIAPSDKSEAAIQLLCDHKVPTVLIDRPYPSIPVSSVYIDNSQMAYNATNYLIKQKNCKRIAFIMYDSTLYNMTERRRGYEVAMAESGLSDHSLIRTVRHKLVELDVIEIIEDLLKGDNPIDGIFFSTNTIALKGIGYLLQQKVALGQSLQVVCYDKNELIELVPELVSYIEQPIETMGRQASQLLVKQMSNSSCEVQNVELNAELVQV